MSRTIYRQRLAKLVHCTYLVEQLALDGRRPPQVVCITTLYHHGPDFYQTLYNNPHNQPDNASRHKWRTPERTPGVQHKPDYTIERYVKVGKARQAATEWRSPKRTPKFQHKPTVWIPDDYHLTADRQTVSYTTWDHLDNLDDLADVFSIGPTLGVHNIGGSPFCQPGWQHQ